jgi:VWFA-related protein
MRKIVDFIVLCTSCWAFTGVAAAQNTATPESGVTIRANVNEVALDLTVRDKKGRVVKTIQPGDLEIYEDGVRQQVLSFRLVTGREAQPAAPAPATPGAPAPAAGAKGASLPLRALNVVSIVFQNLNPVSEKWAVEAARELLNTDLPPGTWIGVFHLGPGLAVLQPYATNRNDLIQASRNGFTASSVDFVAAASKVLNANLSAVYADEAGLRIGGAAMGNSVSLDTGGPTGLATNPQTEEVIGMIRMLGVLPGRKTVLLLSPGLAEVGAAERLTRVVAAANKAGLTIYSVVAPVASDTSSSLVANVAMASALSMGQTGIAPRPASGPQGPTPTGPPPSVTMQRSRIDGSNNDLARTSNQQGVLRSLAEGTGGFLIVKSGDRKPFQRIVDDLDTHYEAVYRPPSAKFDGRLRKIEIKLARPDLKVESRAGYFAMPDIKGSPLKPFEVAALMALSDKTQPHAFDFRSGAFQFRPQGETSQYGVAYEVPIANLTATAVAGAGKHRLHLSLVALVKDADGQVVDKFSQDSGYEIQDDNLAAAQETPVSYSHPLNLPPGRYTIETVLVDQEAHRTTAGAIQIDNAERKGLSLSSVMLVKQLDSVVGQGDPADPFQFKGRRVVPEIATTVSPSLRPNLYFAVYPDKANAEKPTVEIQVLQDGEVVSEQEADLAAPDASGVIAVMVGGTPVKPGNYEVRVTAVQGDDSAEQSVKYSVAAQ